MQPFRPSRVFPFVTLPPRRGPIPIVAAAMLMLATTGLRRVVAAEPGKPPSAHVIDVTIKGPVALVEVTRRLDNADIDRETVLDIALPAHSELLDVRFGRESRWQRTQAAPLGPTAASYSTMARSRGVEPASLPLDASAAYRVRFLPTARLGHDGETREGETRDRETFVRYQYSTLVEAGDTDGRFVVRFPPSLAMAQVSADVTVTVFAPPGTTVTELDVAGAVTHGGKNARRIVGVGVGHEAGHEGKGWQLAFSLAGLPSARVKGAAGPAADTTVKALAAAADGRDRTFGALLARSSPPVVPRSADRALFVIDRSRSVGLAGLSAERDFVHAVLEAMPPATRFDAIVFDRTARRLFTTPRGVTREALAAVDDALVPGNLGNGTDLPAALRLAGDTLRGGRDVFGPRTWLFVLTDGALAAYPTAGALDAALGSLPGLDVLAAAITLRPEHEEPPGDAARQALSALAWQRGGVEASLPTRALDVSARAIVGALERGGDVHGVRLRGPDADGPTFTSALAPGGFTLGAFRLKRRAARLDLVATVAGRPLDLPLRPIAVNAEWLEPHASASAHAAPRPARIASATFGVGLVEPIEHEAPPAEPKSGGGMDRSVLRNTFALAFMPRARACYQNRPLVNARARDLAGRVRLQIEIERGEITGVALPLSTLGDAAVESCLKEAAFAVEVPRAYGADAPTEAVLNLLFTPRGTPERRARPAADEAALAREFDLVLETAPTQFDPRDLLLVQPPDATPVPAPAPPAPAAPRPPAAPQAPARPPVPQKNDLDEP